MELKFIDGFTKEILELEKIPVDNGKNLYIAKRFMQICS